MKNQPIPLCPYVGLQPYTETEREYFFGREQDTETIAANLLTAPLTLLYGASGVGKTSVLTAGVVPYLSAMPDVLVVQFRAWQDETFQVALRNKIGEAVQDSSGKLLGESTPLRLDEFLAQTAQEINRTLLVILDQFEEYFLYHSDANSFDEQFARAVNRGDVNANFLLSMREDVLSQLDRFETRIPNLMSNYLRLEHLNRAGAERAIRKPLEVYNTKRSDAKPIMIEDGLVNTLINQVQTGRVKLGQAGQGDVAVTPSADARIETPFLQMVLTRLWEEEIRARTPNLKLETLNRLGGVEKIVRTHLDTVMNKLHAPEQEICSAFFDRLVTPSGTKIAQNADDLVTYAARPAVQVISVLKKLADARVLRPIAPPLNQPHATRYEIFHDVLAAGILDWQRRFIDRKRVRRLRLIALGATLLVVVFATLAILAVTSEARAIIQSHAAATAQLEAVKQKQISESRRLAAQSTSNQEADFNLALLLGVEALRLDTNYDARNNLLGLLASKPQLVSYLRWDTVFVYSVMFSPDGKTLASGNDDGTIILWDVSKRTPIGQPRKEHTRAVKSVVFSPDGKTLASGSRDGTIRLWDVSSRTPIDQPLSGYNTSPLNSMAFSPDGKTLASGYDDGTIILWDVSKRTRIDQPLGNTRAMKDPVNSVAFSPDGKTLASGYDDGTIILWDVSKRTRIDQPLGNTRAMKNPVNSVAFSPDGKTLASGYDDGTIILWDVSKRTRIDQPLGNTRAMKDPVNSVAFSPDSKTLASGNDDGTTILWDVSTHQPIGQPLSGYNTSPVYSVAFSPDGKTLASGSRDATIRLWDVSSESWQALACQIANRNLTIEEWKQYINHDLSTYRGTCPGLPLNK